MLSLLGNPIYFWAGVNVRWSHSQRESIVTGTRAHVLAVPTQALYHCPIIQKYIYRYGDTCSSGIDQWLLFPGLPGYLSLLKSKEVVPSTETQGTSASSKKLKSQRGMYELSMICLDYIWSVSQWRPSMSLRFTYRSWLYKNPCLNETSIQCFVTLFMIPWAFRRHESFGW